MSVKSPRLVEDWRQIPIPLQTLDDSRASARGVTLSIARMDSLHDKVSGNKWFKLLPNLLRAQQQGYQRVLSFGGPWSNHIHALAWAGRHYGFDTVGLIRGYADLPDTATLADARRWGMQLHFLDHQAYARKEQEAYLEQLQKRFGPCYLVPEGGCNRIGIDGCSLIWDALQQDAAYFTTAVLAVGTGASLAGLIQAPQGPPRLLGVSVMKGDDKAQQRVANLLPADQPRSLQWEIETGCHFGGYARMTPELKTFIEDFFQRHDIVLEPVYTGKMLFALFQRIEAGWFTEGEQVLAIHTGGLQGLRGYCGTWPWALRRLEERPGTG